jgi:hypothetical protein
VGKKARPYDRLLFSSPNLSIRIRVPGTPRSNPSSAMDSRSISARSPPEHLDPHRRAHARRQHVDPGANGRRDCHLVPRHAECLVQIARELIECSAAPVGPEATERLF